MNRAEELRYLVLAAQREGNRILADLLRPLGLTPSQAEVLRVLAQGEHLSLLELGERLVCEAGSPSRLVDGLVKAGHVDRVGSPDDRRRVELSLTATGRRAAGQVATVEQDLHALIEAVIPADTLETVTSTLWRLVADRPAGRALVLRSTSPVQRTRNDR